MTLDSLAEHCEGRLAKFKRPRAYLVLDALPRNAQGKVPRGRVREMVLARYRLIDGAHPVVERL